MFQAYQKNDIRDWNIYSCACRKIDSERVKELALTYFNNYMSARSIRSGFIITLLACMALPFLFNYYVDPSENEFIKAILAVTGAGAFWVALIGLVSAKHGISSYKRNKRELKDIQNELLSQHEAYIWFERDRMYLGFKLPEKISDQ